MKPQFKVKVDRCFINKANGQLTITLPKKKMHGITDPKKIEVSFR